MPNDLSYYSVVWYVPDPVRGERINVGVVVTSQDGSLAAAKFPQNFLRARAFGRERADFLKEFARTVEQQAQAQLNMLDAGRCDLEWLQRLSREWSNSIQLSEPRVSTLAVDALLNQVYETFVREPAARAHGFRDRRSVAGLARRALKKAILDLADRPEAADVVQQRTTIPGKFETHRFDIAIVNGRPLLGAQAISFEVPESEALQRDVDAVAWAIDDVRKRYKTTELAVVALPPVGSRRSTTIFNKARRMYRGLDAQFVVEEDVEVWASETAAGLPARLM